MEVYGAPDRARDGNVASQMPAWYLETQIDDLNETIHNQEGRLNRGEVPADEVPEARALLARDKEKLANIKDSKPEVKATERDKLQKHYKDLSKLIGDTMFTNDQMRMGTASPHEEAKRMKNPIIKLTKDLCDLAKTCNVNVHTGGMVGRDGASKMWKIVGKLIEEPTNVESLRR